MPAVELATQAGGHCLYLLVVAGCQCHCEEARDLSSSFLRNMDDGKPPLHVRRTTLNFHMPYAPEVLKS